MNYTSSPVRPVEEAGCNGEQEQKQEQEKGKGRERESQKQRQKDNEDKGDNKDEKSSVKKLDKQKKLDKHFAMDDEVPEDEEEEDEEDEDEEDEEDGVSEKEEGEEGCSGASCLSKAVKSDLMVAETDFKQMVEDIARKHGKDVEVRFRYLEDEGEPKATRSINIWNAFKAYCAENGARKKGKEGMLFSINYSTDI